MSLEFFLCIVCASYICEVSGAFNEDKGRLSEDFSL